jgi:hypothetical protein
MAMSDEYNYGTWNEEYWPILGCSYFTLLSKPRRVNISGIIYSLVLVFQNAASIRKVL